MLSLLGNQLEHLSTTDQAPRAKAVSKIEKGD